ncbi:MAG: 1-deoxy-D-xylulose-5-phosphate reductoisomerase [Deltaproteobacteria bacterium]|nr:MAG: 1-deoxy-D-xylulose-5-phosphate reductoisomerase [Deltaproteobacteria bacterium]
MKNIALLGSTGSIGTNVLNLVRSFPDRYRIVSLAAGKNVRLLARQCLEFRPEIVSVYDEQHAKELKKLLPHDFPADILFGLAGNKAAAASEQADFTVSAIVGAAGLLPTLAAIEAGKDIGLANKETLVMAGRLVMQAVREHGVRLLPIDSEHSAIFQALEGGRKDEVAKIILTASGGPFYLKSFNELKNVTREQALNHPNWSMGQKISIDSATLMNKGLEVIEAKWLFDVSAKDLEVVVHPQSIVHSLVEYHDGSVIAQLGLPDMQIPIAYALSYPARLPLKLERLHLPRCSNLEFIEPDYKKFPALGLARTALEEGGVLPAVLNAANEAAVAAFLLKKIDFLAIPKVIAQTMEQAEGGDDTVLDDILQADVRARTAADEMINQLPG